jgi:acyl carrier protein
MTDDVAARVIRIVAEQAMLDPASITPQTSINDLGLDSLAVVEVVFRIAEEFGVPVPFNANEPRDATKFDISTVGQMIAGVRKLVAEEA